MLEGKQSIRPAVWAVAVYFALMAADSVDLGHALSLMRLIAIVPVVMLLIEYRNLEMPFHPIFSLQLLFFLLALVSIFYTLDPARTLNSDLILGRNLLLVFLIGSLNYRDSEIRLLEHALVVGGWVLVILMFIFADYSGGRLTLKLGATAQNQNAIFGYMVFAVAFHMYYALWRRSLIHMAAVGALLAVVLLTGSRGSLIAFFTMAVAFALIYMYHSENRLRNIIIVAAAAILLILAFQLILDHLSSEVAIRFSWDYIEERRTTGRTETWRALLSHYKTDSFGALLFGHGYGTTMLLNTYNGNVAHNLYIDNLISLGLVGALLQIATHFSCIAVFRHTRSLPMLCAFLGLVSMCMSVSLVAYKPIWIAMTLALVYSGKARIESHY